MAVFAEPWRAAFSTMHCEQSWRKTGYKPFSMCVYWDLLEKERRIRAAVEAAELTELKLDEKIWQAKHCGKIGVDLDSEPAPISDEKSKGRISTGDLGLQRAVTDIEVIKCLVNRKLDKERKKAKRRSGGKKQERKRVRGQRS
mmetsp:Transcript_8145/g.19995  ORF Transcript_8145/g.19995 Transcript_8145/m.19995 type:complete len:143 (-) Transcript_8145:551-979(-)